MLSTMAIANPKVWKRAVGNPNPFSGLAKTTRAFLSSRPLIPPLSSQLIFSRAITLSLLDLVKPSPHYKLQNQLCSTPLSKTPSFMAFIRYVILHLFA